MIVRPVFFPGLALSIATFACAPIDDPAGSSTSNSSAGSDSSGGAGGSESVSVATSNASSSSSSAGSGSGGDSGAEPAEVKTDLAFRKPNGKSIAGDLYLPERSAPVPAVLVIHGGGFSSGDKAGNGEIAWSEYLQANGYAAFSVNYRVYKDFSAQEVPFPNAVGDLKCAVRWLRHKASEHKIDPNHIFVLGGSAGGFMTNILGTTGDEPSLAPTDCSDGAAGSDRVQGVVSYFGPSDWNALFTDPARVDSQNGEKQFIGLTTPCTNPVDQSGICTTASATHWADKNDPPFYISHSDDDPVVPVSQSRVMKAALEAAKVDVTYHEITGQKHGWLAKFGSADVAAIRDEVMAWLDAHSGS